jgi:dihydrofolate reductase
VSGVLSLIVAVGPGGAIGRNGALPWHAPEDMAHFRKVTRDHTLVMGRGTWDSIGRPLPRRHLVVVSRRPLDLPDGAEWAGDLDTAVDRAFATDPEPIVAGGAAIYAALLDRVGRIHLTEVDVEIDGADTFFELDDVDAWTESCRWSGVDPRLTFRVLDRITALPASDPPAGPSSPSAQSEADRRAR